MNRTPRFARLACAIALVLLLPAFGGVNNVRASGAEANGAPPGYSTTVPGGSHDFDFLTGAWTLRQKYLKETGVGSSDWTEGPATQHCAVAHLGGRVILDESRYPDGSPSGLFLLGYDQAKRQWSIFWISAKSGRPDAGTVGGFSGSRGDFYGPDQDGKGRAIKVRVRWTVLDHDHVRWEQAFSYDNRTWETNWVAHFTRANPATGCRKS